jgi:RimJ/RimL family protein N-acetyltransferase
MSDFEIETERLALRKHLISDFDDSFAMWSDPVVTRFIGGKPSTEQQAWSRLLNYAGHWSLLGFGYWAVVEKATQQFIGEVGFANFRRGLEPAMSDFPELGWAFATQYHGKGYATEAVRAALAWADTRFDSRTVCLIDAENLTSIRVAQKCGYTEFKQTLFNARSTKFFQRLPESRGR